jgi:hypothetical protein
LPSRATLQANPWTRSAGMSRSLLKFAERALLFESYAASAI